MTLLNELPDPSTVPAGTQRITSDGNALVSSRLSNGTAVWNQEIVNIGRDELDFIRDMDGNISADLASGRVLTLTAGNELTTSLQGSLSRAGVIFSELVSGLTPAHPQDDYEYFIYDVSLLLGQPARDTFVTRGIGSDAMGGFEAFFMGVEGGGVDPDSGVAIAPYYIYRF